MLDYKQIEDRLNKILWPHLFRVLTTGLAERICKDLVTEIQAMEDGNVQA